MKILNACVVVVIILALSLLRSQIRSERQEANADNGDLQEQIDREAERLRRVLPMQTGPGVEWFDVETSVHKLIYKYRVEADRVHMISRKEDVRSAIETQVKPLMKPLLDKGVSIVCNFYDRNMSLAFSLTYKGDNANDRLIQKIGNDDEGWEVEIIDKEMQP